MGPFVRAVTLSEGSGGQSWDYVFARLRGWDDAGLRVYLEARASVNGPGWSDYVECGVRAEVRETFGRSVVEQVMGVW